MTEGSNKLAHIDFDQEIKSTAVAGAVAVQKLIADRNRLREELTASLAAQADYRRRLQALHQRYIELARRWSGVCSNSTAQCERQWAAKPRSRTEALSPNHNSMATEYLCGSFSPTGMDFPMASLGLNLSGGDLRPLLANSGSMIVCAAAHQLSEIGFSMMMNCARCGRWQKPTAPSAPYIQLLLLTGQRREKVAAMRWSDIAIDGTWTIPSLGGRP